jgi:hypothetical protein
MPRTEKYFIGPQLLGDIRRVVGRVDGEPYRVTGVTQDVRLQDMPRRQAAGFRICNFTGTWSIDASKTVTFRGVTATPNTVVAHNLFAEVSAGTATSAPCAIARDGTAWYLIAARCL